MCWQEAEICSEHSYTDKDATFLKYDACGRSDTWSLLAASLKVLELSSKTWVWLALEHWSHFSVTNVSARCLGPWYFWNYLFLCWWKRRFAKSGEAIDYFKWSSVYPWKIGKESNVLSEQGCAVVKHGIGKLCRILPSSDLEFESKLFAVILISQPLWPNLAKLQWDFFSKA